MNKQALLKEAYDSAFNDELEKTALSKELLQRAGLAASKKLGLKGTLAMGLKKMTREGAKIELDMLKSKRGSAASRALQNKKTNVARELEKIELVQSQIK